MARRGPPRKDSYERRTTILENLKQKLPFSYSCDLAGVDRNTGYRWMHEDPEFAAQVAAAKVVAIKDLVGKVTEKEPWKILKNLGKEEFKDQVTVENKSTYKLVVDPGDGEPDKFPGF